jgi:hypothetical protein
MKTRLSWILAGCMLLAAALLAAQSIWAQSGQPTMVTTQGRFVVEEVKVGGSCVVIVSRVGSGPSDHLAVVPCNR